MDVSAIVETIASSVDAVGLVVGGLWVAWTFHKLQRVRAAEVDVQKTLADTQKTTAETLELDHRRVSQQPNLEVTFSQMVEHETPESDCTYLAVTTDLLNSGSRNLQVDFSDATMTLARFDLLDRRLRRVSDVHRTGPGYFRDGGDQIAEMPYRILRAGQRRRMVTLLPAPRPGVYLVEFRALYRMLPFEGEDVAGEVDCWVIDAVEQALVAVGLEHSRVLVDEGRSGAPVTE